MRFDDLTYLIQTILSMKVEYHDVTTNREFAVLTVNRGYFFSTRYDILHETRILTVFPDLLIDFIFRCLVMCMCTQRL